MLTFAQFRPVRSTAPSCLAVLFWLRVLCYSVCCSSSFCRSIAMSIFLVQLFRVFTVSTYQILSHFPTWLSVMSSILIDPDLSFFSSLWRSQAVGCSSIVLHVLLMWQFACVYITSPSLCSTEFVSLYLLVKLALSLLVLLCWFASICFWAVKFCLSNIFCCFLYALI